MDLLNNRRTLVVSAAAALATILFATMAFRALSVREPPLEAEGDAGLRIRLVEPPKSSFKPSGLLEVGVSGVDQDRATTRADRIAPSAARPRRVALDQGEDHVPMVRADAAVNAASDAADRADREGDWQEHRARADRWAREDERRDAEIYAERYGPPRQEWVEPSNDREPFRAR